MVSRQFLSSAVRWRLFRLSQILLLALFLYAPGVVKGDQLVLIDFDSPLPLDAGQSQGVFLSTILINASGTGQGTFGGVVLLPTAAAVSPPQAAFAAQVNPLFNGVNGISGQFLFTTSEGVVVPAATQSVSFNVVGSQGTWTVLFFDTTNPIASDLQTGLIATFTGNTDQLVVFSTSAGIGRFVFIPSGLNVFEGIDNLQFEATSVPEPATLLLLTLGVGGLLAATRYKRFRDHSK